MARTGVVAVKHCGERRMPARSLLVLNMVWWLVHDVKNTQVTIVINNFKFMTFI